MYFKIYPFISRMFSFVMSEINIQRLAYSLLVLLTISSTVSVQAQRAIPELWGLHVHDEAHILSQQTVDKLEKQLIAYEDSTTNQIAILIIPSLEGEVIEEFSLRVAEKWKLGDENKDNGVLLLIAIDDHKMRIEVGEGLEGVLTDALSSRIIRNEIAPKFRQNKYDEGVLAAITGITRAIGGEYQAGDDDAAELGWPARILISVFVFGILGVFTFLGLFIPGCGGWFLYAFLIPFYAAFPMVVLGTATGVSVLIAYVIGFPILKLMLNRSDWGKKMAKKMATAKSQGGRGWSSGSGWSSGGGRSSGGFSGGGGSFGGGGSSGSW
ncbi:TPM domain-containing protein [Chryseolinea sp. H1M3-3]|uniref:TPM domain-containing protein n=1 Tax=Chryseolinea sp. H1M3-3 TaxID=3034144 RepID=UPI0023EB10EE|nr:TPM domain-containing protein [Chryseolinea sp. H1M3-3]